MSRATQIDIPHWGFGSLAKFAARPSRRKPFPAWLENKVTPDGRGSVLGFTFKQRIGFTRRYACDLDPKQSAKGKRAMKPMIKRYVHDEQGATAIEYALIAVFVSIVFLAAAEAIGGDLNSTFAIVSSALR